MFKLLFALWRHVWLVMTFRHSGAGLPDKHGGPSALIVAAFLAVVLVRSVGFMDLAAWKAIMSVGAFGLVVGCLMRPRPFMLFSLASIGTNIAAVALYAVEADPGQHPLRIILTLWEISAFSVALLRHIVETNSSAG